MTKHRYGHKRPDIGALDFADGWIRGVRHLASKSATGSFWHRHGETSVVCCLHGEYTYELHGIPSVTLTAGSFLVIPAQIEHRHIKAVDPIGERLEILLSPSPAKPLRHSAFSQESHRRLHAALLKHSLRPVRCDKRLLETCRELHSLAGRTARILSQEELGLARILCQYILYKMAMPHTSVQKRNAIRFAEISTWLEKHLPEKIDINRLVAYIGYSRTQVFTLFHEHTGLTPSEFLTRLRIRKARLLLETTDFTASRVAALCGFSSASVFNSVFRRQTGYTPLAWRNRT